MSTKPLFPMLVDLSEKKVVVVGEGPAALQKIKALVPYTNDLVVIAEVISPELEAVEKEGKLGIIRKGYEREDIYGADIVIAASAKSAVNQDIYAACRCLGISVHVADDKNCCDFYFQ